MGQNGSLPNQWEAPLILQASTLPCGSREMQHKKKKNLEQTSSASSKEAMRNSKINLDILSWVNMRCWAKRQTLWPVWLHLLHPLIKILLLLTIVTRWRWYCCNSTYDNTLSSWTKPISLQRTDRINPWQVRHFWQHKRTHSWQNSAPWCRPKWSNASLACSCRSDVASHRYPHWSSWSHGSRRVNRYPFLKIFLLLPNSFRWLPIFVVLSSA